MNIPEPVPPAKENTTTTSMRLTSTRAGWSAAYRSVFSICCWIVPRIAE